MNPCEPKPTHDRDRTSTDAGPEPATCAWVGDGAAGVRKVGGMGVEERAARKGARVRRGGGREGGSCGGKVVVCGL